MFLLKYKKFKLDTASFYAGEFVSHCTHKIPNIFVLQEKEQFGFLNILS